MSFAQLSPSLFLQNVKFCSLRILEQELCPRPCYTFQSLFLILQVTYILPPFPATDNSLKAAKKAAAELARPMAADLCATRSVGAESLKQHVLSERHQRRLGRFHANDHEIETFRYLSLFLKVRK